MIIAEKAYNRSTEDNALIEFFAYFFQSTHLGSNIRCFSVP